ncbi:hypothetical protein C8R44DRAFT_869035 [Mycena epipterygia]|nr:hypothetical protein C8R44DRAFT_869035 [Mycena epipterygia]
MTTPSFDDDPRRTPPTHTPPPLATPTARRTHTRSLDAPPIHTRSLLYHHLLYTPSSHLSYLYLSTRVFVFMCDIHRHLSTSIQGPGDHPLLSSPRCTSPSYIGPDFVYLFGSCYRSPHPTSFLLRLRTTKASATPRVGGWGVCDVLPPLSTTLHSARPPTTWLSFRLPFTHPPHLSSLMRPAVIRSVLAGLAASLLYPSRLDALLYDFTHAYPPPKRKGEVIYLL